MKDFYNEQENMGTDIDKHDDLQHILTSNLQTRADYANVRCSIVPADSISKQYLNINQVN